MYTKARTYLWCILLNLLYRPMPRYSFSRELTGPFRADCVCIWSSMLMGASTTHALCLLPRLGSTFSPLPLSRLCYLSDCLLARVLSTLPVSGTHLCSDDTWDNWNIFYPNSVPFGWCALHSLCGPILIKHESPT